VLLIEDGLADLARSSTAPTISAELTGRQSWLRLLADSPHSTARGVAH